MIILEELAELLSAFIRNMAEYEDITYVFKDGLAGTLVEGVLGWWDTFVGFFTSLFMFLQ